MAALTLRLAIAAVFVMPVLAAAQDGDVSLTIRFAEGSNQFKVGQVIRLELKFRAATPNKYSFSAILGDRSGRSGVDEFQVIPKGRDPLYSYYDSAGPMMYGGLSTVRTLGKEP